MKFYISGPSDKGDGPYCLIAETGEVVAGHYCSSLDYARGDLTTTFKNRKVALEAEFGPFEGQHQVAWIYDVPQEEQDALLARNRAVSEAVTP